MGNVILIIWALFMLWSNLKSIKSVYFTKKEVKEENLKHAIEKFKDADEGSLLGCALWFTCITVACFWLALALTFTNPFIVVYCCVMISLCIAAPYRSAQIIEKNEYTHVDKTSYITVPINIVIIASFIIMLIL